MSRVSRLTLEQDHQAQVFNSFWSLITLLENKDQVKHFLKDLFTHTEMKMMAKRVQIAKMLLEGYKYQEIKGFLKVTDSTIARVNNILETGGEGLKVAIAYLQKIESDVEKDKMRITPKLKEKYGVYFIPDKGIKKIEEKIKVTKKRNSVKQDLSL